MSKRAIICGQARETLNNVVTYFPGPETEAELVAPVHDAKSDVWWVRMIGDNTDRVRRIVRRVVG